MVLFFSQLSTSFKNSWFILVNDRLGPLGHGVLRPLEVHPLPRVLPPIDQNVVATRRLRRSPFGSQRLRKWLAAFLLVSQFLLSRFRFILGRTVNLFRLSVQGWL